MPNAPFETVLQCSVGLPISCHSVPFNVPDQLSYGIVRYCTSEELHAEKYTSPPLICEPFGVTADLNSIGGSDKMKWRTASRNVYRYVRHDLREIVWPSSLPNPPGYEATRPPRFTFKEHAQVSQ